MRNLFLKPFGDGQTLLCNSETFTNESHGTYRKINSQDYIYKLNLSKSNMLPIWDVDMWKVTKVMYFYIKNIDYHGPSMHSLHHTTY